MIVEFSNDFENSIGSIGEKRQKALVEVQKRYSGSAAVRKGSSHVPLCREGYVDDLPSKSVSATCP